MKTSPFIFRSFNPWFYFLLWGTTNAILSYSSLSITVKFEIGLLGLVLPWIIAWYSFSDPSHNEIFAQPKEFLPGIPAWFWLLVGSLALFVRLFKLTTLSVWPHYDEGVYGYYAIQLNEKWDWRLFYGDSRVPPLFVWILSLVFRIFGTSLSSLWLLPALISILVVPASYLASSRFFSKSFSVVCTMLMAFSFWPWLLGRFSFMTGLVLLAECLVLYCLGNFLNSSTLSFKKKWAFSLGFLLSLGFLIHIHWVSIAVLLVGTLLFDLKTNGKAAQETLLFWALPLVALSLPMLYLCVTKGYGSYLWHLAAFHQTSSWAEQAAISFSCFSALFWGMDPHFHTYQPFWGGFLNPILGSLFFLGLLEILKKPQPAMNRWLLCGFFFFLLPGIMTSDLETFRMVPVIPVLLVITAIGLQQLVSSFPGKKATILSLLLLILSAALDTYHLFGVYHHLWDSPNAWHGYVKSMEQYRAYELLRQKSSQEGPGLVFSDFIQGLPNQNLCVADYDFNAAQNPRLSFENTKWAAVLTNVNYQPFLAKRFPDGRYAWLSKDQNAPDGGLMLWIFPLDSSRLQEMKKWQQASLALKPFLDANIGYSGNGTYGESLKTLEGAAPAFQGDPFLESCFWEKTAGFLVDPDNGGDMLAFRNRVFWRTR